VRARTLLVLALTAAASLGPILPRPAGPLRGMVRPALAADLPRVSFVAAPGASILVHGTYPRVASSCVDPVQAILHARYRGTIEVGRDTDGKLFVVGVLPFEDYLKGIAEMPRTWPMEALKAQVVAARSYALAHMRYPDPTGERLGYQLCATDACQVYRGMGVSAGPYGDRWDRAVNATVRQVLLFGGRPADTLYFSTSKGSTVGNEQVFGTAPLPYLRPVIERDDGASPLSHWTSTLAFADVGRFLRAGGLWSGGSVTSVTRSGNNVVVRGTGASKTLSVTDFRSSLNYWAPCLEPASYPGYSGGIRLPQTIPSKWFAMSRRGAAVALTGRGWGHGVGMVQWGAYGKALRGLRYAEILAAYYGGLRPVEYAEPSEIRIGIATGLTTVRIAATGVVSATGTGVQTGPWLITGGKALRVRRGAQPPTYIAAGRILKAPSRARSGRTITATVTVPVLSVVRLVLEGPGPDVLLAGRTETPGQATITARVPSIPTGTYGLRAQFTNGIDIARSARRTIRVSGTVGSPSPSPSPSALPTPSPTPTGTAAALPAQSSSRSVPLVLVAGGAVLLAGVAFLLVLRVRRRPGRPAPPG